MRLLVRCFGSQPADSLQFVLQHRADSRLDAPAARGRHARGGGSRGPPRDAAFSAPSGGGESAVSRTRATEHFTHRGFQRSRSCQPADCDPLPGRAPVRVTRQGARHEPGPSRSSPRLRRRACRFCSACPPAAASGLRCARGPHRACCPVLRFVGGARRAERDHHVATGAGGHSGRFGARRRDAGTSLRSPACQPGEPAPVHRLLPLQRYFQARLQHQRRLSWLRLPQGTHVLLAKPRCLGPALPSLAGPPLRRALLPSERRRQ